MTNAQKIWEVFKNELTQPATDDMREVIIGTGALDEDDYIIDKPIGFDMDSQSEVYHKDSAIKLIGKGITHFIPYNENCPPLIFCNPLDFDNL